MKKPEWYEDEIERLAKDESWVRLQAQKYIENKVKEYMEEFDYSEEVAFKYYIYVRDYFIEKEEFAMGMFKQSILSGEVIPLEECRIHYECMNQNYFDMFDELLENDEI